MIRIPTGSVPKNTARTITLIGGLVSLIASFFVPALATPLRELGLAATGLGTTLGKQ